MPRGKERNCSYIERILRREATTSSRRPPNQISYNSRSEEQLPHLPGVRDSEQRRCTVLYTAIEHGSCILLKPLGYILHGNEGRNQLGPEDETKLDHLDSAESSTGSSSSGISTLGKSRTRSKWTRSAKNISAASNAGTVLNGTPGSGFDLVTSVESVDRISEVEKPVRKISKKKKKKKGKRHRRSRLKDTSGASQSEVGAYHISVSETSISSNPTSPRKHISENMMERVASPLRVIRDAGDAEEDGSAENSNDFRNKPATTVSCASYNDEMQSLEPVASHLGRVSGKNLVHDHVCKQQSGSHAISSCTTASSEIILPTNLHPLQNGICEASEIIQSASSCSTSDIHSNRKGDTSCGSNDPCSSSQPCSFLEKINIDTFKNSIDVQKCGDASDCSSEGGLVLDPTEYNASLRSITADSYDRSIDMSSYFSMDGSELSNSLVNAYSTDERIQCSSEASSSDDFQPVVYRKRGRLGRNTSFNSNNSYRSGSVNLHGWARKNSKNNGTCGCISRSQSDNQHVEVYSKLSEARERFGKVKVWKKIEPSTDEKINETVDTDSIEPPYTDVNSNDLLLRTNNGRLSQNFQEILRAPSSSSDQACPGIIHGSRSSEIKMAIESQFHLQEEVETPLQVITHQQIGSPSNSDCAGEVDYCQSESSQSNQSHSLESQYEISSSSTESDLLESTYTEVHSSGANICSESSGSMSPEIESTDSGSGLEVSLMNDLTSDRLEPGSGKLESPSSDISYLTPSNSRSPCSSCHSQEAESACTTPHAVDEHSHQSGSSCKVEGHAVETEPSAGFETDLCKIMQTVDESYKFMRASEVFHQTTGDSIAEFEKLIFSVSPRIGQSIRGYKACSRDKIIGDALYLCQVPHISLGNIWQWYEKPGSYGLELKGDDYLKSKKSHNGRSQFRAYFAPYLSAVQLFARSRSSVNFNGDESYAMAKEHCEEDNKSKSPGSLESLPVFSMLLPRSSKIVPSRKDEIYCPTIRGNNLTDEELLFEYFEADQPQQRRPLFEKIKELVSGGPASNCNMFGDPSNLERLNLHDLHPASWFAVAWYPIYRIPDGKFRATFLTYHSLGQFAQRSNSSNMTGDVTQVVSPVVGMRSYNAKGENWFVLREFNCNMNSPRKAMSPNPSETLRERLRTLEHTASVMSRAIVRKGGQRSVNRHPDYEFFLSRGR